MQNAISPSAPSTRNPLDARLVNPRHEAFCQARADGYSREEAYEEAGFSPGNDHAHRLTSRPEVRDRIQELRGERADVWGSTTRAVLSSLLKLAEALGQDPTPQAAKEARALRLEARRLRDAPSREREADRDKEAVS